MRSMSRKMMVAGFAAVAALAVGPAAANAAPAQPAPAQAAPAAPADGCSPGSATNPIAGIGNNGEAEIQAEGKATLPDPSTYLTVKIYEDRTGLPDLPVAQSPEGQANGQTLYARAPSPGPGTYYTQLENRGSILCSGPHVNL